MHDGAHRAASENCARNMQQGAAVRTGATPEGDSRNHSNAVHSGARELMGFFRRRAR